MKVFGFGFLVKGKKERETLEKVGKRQEVMKSGVLCVIIREKYWGYSRNVLIISREKVVREGIFVLILIKMSLKYH